MAPRPHSARREAAEELASLLASDGGLHGARLMQLLHLVEEQQPRAEDPAPIREQSGPRPIGIWHPTSRDGALVFERRAPSDAASLLWDPRPTFDAEKRANVRRVCFIGESVAAGWLYAPHVTPARVLEEYLNRVAGPNRYEVLNLARIDLNPAMLVDLVAASRQLDPDVIVIYAGNNWGSYAGTADLMATENFHAAARAYRTGGAAGLMRLTTESVRAEATRTMAAIAHATRGVPVVAIVPEVNLADWERARPVPWLAGDATLRWYRLLRAARAAVRQREWSEAMNAARAMIALDGGCCATSQRMLANALAAVGDVDGARQAARAEVTARAWDNHPHTPSATPDIQDVIRASSTTHGFRCVDLPASCENQLPGRALLLDYCHLTLDGMADAMRAVAAQVLDAAGVSGVRLDELPAPTAPSEVDARTKLLTALYTMHWSSSEAAASAWLADAMEASPGIADEMADYAASRAANPSWLRYSAAQQRLRALVADVTGRVLGGGHIDPRAVDALRHVLGARGDSIPAMDAGDAPIDLLDEPFAWNVADRYEAVGAFSHPRVAFHRAVWPVSRFALPATASRAIQLRVTARLPGIDGPRAGDAAVAVNGREVGRLPLRERWRSESIVVASEHLNRGVNRVSIRWPELPPTGDAAMRAVTRQLELGSPTEVHPTFGQLFRLEARLA